MASSEGNYHRKGPYFDGTNFPSWKHKMKMHILGHNPAVWAMMTHKYRGSIKVLSISKSVEPNEEQKEMTSGFQ